MIADGNFPCHAISERVIRADGLTGTEVLKAILELFPLDTYADYQVYLMDIVPGDNYKPDIWNDYRHALNMSGEEFEIQHLERFAFYERARKAYAVVATGEQAQYANIILKKGVVK